MLGRVVDALTGNQKIKGCVVLMKKDVLGLNDFKASAIDKVEEFFGNRVELHLVSAVQPDPVNNDRGKIGTSASLENWAHLNQAGESTLDVQFEWDDHFGAPGAIIVKNNHSSEFFLKSITLGDVSHVSHVHFDCNSWIYPVNKYKYDRIFFTNQTYLPSEMPLLLRPYRDQELVNLRGTGKGELKEWDRVYDYALYNDLGDPDKSPEDARPVLGNSTEFPYPRRGRTGRPPTKTDPNTESRLPPLVSLNIYVPRDERFGHLKMSDFLAWAIKSITQFVQPGLKSVLDPKDEYETFEDTYKIYEGGIKLPKLNELSDIVPIEIIKELLRTDGAGLYKFPTPQVIQDSKEAWRTDEEFAREMLAGVNPVIISLLKDFPPKSNLDPAEYGNQNSSISAQHIEKGLDGLSVREALAQNKLFILDHHDTLMPYLSRINSTKETKTYASRTLLFLNPDGTLRPLAIELSLPHPDGQRHGAVSKVFTPAKSGIENALWQLAKAYVTVNDSGVHQLISHFLKTHAVIEPFVIATHRQLSAVHPVHKLLSPHYRDTMNINALARQILINAGGILERTVFPGRYAMEMSAVVYRSWVFTEQGLPADLLKRGMAVEDSTQSSKLRLLIEDYPYAVDGLEIWSAIEEWVADYCAIYYPSDDMVEADVELQGWWKEVRELGHGDKKDKPWWPAMRTVSDLASTCTTIIWVSSALHAATNFGQYPYAGYFPNRPTGSRRFMPEPGTPEWAELESDPTRSFLGTISGKFQSLLGIAIIEILSRHSSDEVYLGRRASDGWTGDQRAIDAFQRFGERLESIEEQIMRRNGDAGLKNRVGPVNIAYTLLYPSTSNPGQATGITGKGIPNSVSI